MQQIGTQLGMQSAGGWDNRCDEEVPESNRIEYYLCTNDIWYLLNNASKTQAHLCKYLNKY